jgi:hypothetical protein
LNIYFSVIDKIYGIPKKNFNKLQKRQNEFKLLNYEILNIFFELFKDVEHNGSEDNTITSEEKDFQEKIKYYIVKKI